jgi:hypothetical protein
MHGFNNIGPGNLGDFGLGIMGGWVACALQNLGGLGGMCIAKLG